MTDDITIRPVVKDADADGVWRMLEPVFRAGQTYAVDPGISRKDALAYWFAEHAFLAEAEGRALGTFYVQKNRPGGGAHYCNAGFVTAPGASGRGVARRMLGAALDEARALGFSGMVFNFVVASNARAIAIWERAGFDVVGRVPGAFKGPDGQATDTLVMFKKL